MGREKKVLVAVAALLFVVLGFITILRATKEFKQTDLTVYLAAAGSVQRGGEDLYRITNEREWNYVYLPLFAIVMVPFTKMPLFWAALVWYVLSVVFAAWAIRMSVTLVAGHQADRHRLWLYAVPPGLLAWPFITALTRGQASILLLWLVVAALFYTWRGREFLAATCLAGAVVLKVFPALLLGYYVWRRRWRCVIAACAGIVLGVFVLPAAVLGWHANVSRVREWATIVAKPALERDGASPTSPVYSQLLDPISSRNQSLQAVLWRLGAPGIAPKLAAGVGIVMAVFTVFAGRPGRPHSELLVVCAVLAWMLLVSPVSENHYFVLLLLPLTALAGLSRQSSETSLRRIARGTLILFAALCIPGKAGEYYGPLCWGTLVTWGVLLTAARRAVAEPGGATSRASAPSLRVS